MKLELKKEKIVELNNSEMAQIVGGKDSSPSTARGFTCCWCIKIGGSGTTREGGTNPTVVNPGIENPGFDPLP